MKERGLVLSLITAIFGIFSMNFSSAASYGVPTSFSDVLNSLDPSAVVLGFLLIIFFAFLNFVFSKFFRGNKAISGILAFSISFLAVYGINYYGFDYESLFFNIGLSSDLLYMIMPFILLGGIIFFGVKYGFGSVLFFTGLTLVVISFTDLVYEQGFVFIIGLIIGIIGGFMWIKKKDIGSDYSRDYSSDRDYKQTIPKDNYKKELEERRDKEISQYDKEYKEALKENARRDNQYNRQYKEALKENSKRDNIKKH